MSWFIMGPVHYCVDGIKKTHSHAECRSHHRSNRCRSISRIGISSYWRSSFVGFSRSQLGVCKDCDSFKANGIDIGNIENELRLLSKSDSEISWFLRILLSLWQGTSTVVFHSNVSWEILAFSKITRQKWAVFVVPVPFHEIVIMDLFRLILRRLWIIGK